MPAHDDETETSSQVTSDPALDATDGPENARSPEISADAVADERPRVAFIGRYRVIDALGSGGMGVVYRARDRELDRDLAIKVVRSHSGTTRAQERLLEEARAMAKLRHPAVVPIFDVGVAARGVFIVMPMVGGGTLYDWMKQRRSWREVVAMFVIAGRGLAAAHAAGLVHRDFKPRNVLIGDRGEPMVADFGIATRTDDSIDPENATSTPGQAQVSSIAGTPAYMAPEQAESNTIDARADQYSFCISFWEALCGERPHEAVTRTQGGLSAPVARSISGRANAPAWLLAIVARGFSARPDHRWPSMNDLIEHIERRMRRPRRIAAAVSVLGVLAATATVIAMVPGRDENPCPDPGGRLATVWTPATRVQVEKAFKASGLPYADESLARTLPALDEYASSWRDSSIAVCRAARVDRTQSEALRERRSSCLDRRLAALAARTVVLRKGDAAAIKNAAAAVDSLPLLADCDDTESLLAYPAPNGADKGMLIDALEARIDQIEAAGIAGDAREQLGPLEAVVAEARAIEHPPLLARALELQALALRRVGAPTESTLRTLVQAASEGRDDAALVRAWSYLIEDLAVRQQKVAEARALEPVATAALVRAGSSAPLRLLLHSALAESALAAEELDTALTRWRDALEAASKPGERARIASRMATVLGAQGRYAEAVPIAEDALRATEQARGALHPETTERRLDLESLRTKK